MRLFHRILCPAACCCLALALMSFRPYYAPTTLMAPLFCEPRELRVGLSLTPVYSTFYQKYTYERPLRLRTYELNAAWSFSPHWSAAFAYQRVRAFTEEERWEALKGGYGEVMAGYTRAAALGSSFFSLELFGGAGIGAYRIHYVESYIAPESYGRSGYYKFFLQPLAGFSINEVFEVALVSRFSLLHFRNMTADNAAPVTRTFSYVQDRPNVFLLEPGVSLRLGKRYVKAFLQSTLSIPFNTYEVANIINIHAGLTLSLAPRFRTRQMPDIPRLPEPPPHSRPMPPDWRER